MARTSGQANEPGPADQGADCAADRELTIESIFGRDETAGDDVFLSATEETVAMLNSVFGGDPALFDGSFSLGFLSFG